MLLEISTLPKMILLQGGGESCVNWRGDADTVAVVADTLWGEEVIYCKSGRITLLFGRIILKTIAICLK